VSRSFQDGPAVLRSAEHVEAQDLFSFLEKYQPMLGLLSAVDLDFLKCQGNPGVGRFRRKRAVIYFQYLRELCRDLRALPLWDAPRDAEAFIKLDKAAWMMQKMLVKLALEGALYYIGIPRRDTGLVRRWFESLDNLLSAVA
jgi:hypothetical protein